MRPRDWIALGLGLCIVTVTVGGCAGNAGRRVTTRSRTQRLTVPYPVGEPVVSHSGPRVTLREATYLRLLDADTLLSDLVAPGDPRHADLVKRARDDEPLDAAALEALGIPGLGDSILVVSTEGPCRAEIGAPSLVPTDDGSARIAVHWALSGCDQAELAPLAVVTRRLPDALRWTPAVRTVDLTLTPGVPWDNALESLMLHPDWGGGGIPTARIIEVREVPETEPPVVQIYDALIRQEGDTHDPCRDADAWMQTNGWFHGSWLDPIEPGTDPAAAPHLLGALTHDGLVDALVYVDRQQPMVVVPETIVDADEELPAVTRYAAPDDPIALAQAWGWSPFTGQTGFTPRCEGTVSR